MSAVPPGRPPRPPSFRGSPTSSRDPAGALVDSAKLFATNPDEAWRITPERGGIERPLLFGLIVSFVGSVFAFVYRWLFVSPFVRMFSGPVFRRFGWMMGTGREGAASSSFRSPPRSRSSWVSSSGGDPPPLRAARRPASKTSASGFEVSCFASSPTPRPPAWRRSFRSSAA